MPLTLDPPIVQLLPDPAKRTNFIVEILTSTPRRWTPYPGGLVVSGVTYSPLDVAVSGVVEALDQTQPSAAVLTIPSASGAAGDLVRDTANRWKPVTVKRVWFDASWNIAGTELWFEGLTGKPAQHGPFVSLALVQRHGRRGTSPTRPYAELLTSHRIPESSQKVTWG